MQRSTFLEKIDHYLHTHKVVALLGPRQCGKTTLARMYAKQQKGFSKTNYFDLESPLDLGRLSNPLLALQPLKKLIIIDEIQKVPDLFSVLRVLVDEEDSDQRYLILGSASTELIRQSSESLAGRIAYLELTPFSFNEVLDLDRLWIRGGFPMSFLARAEEESFQWREFYIRTYLEQDIPNLGIKIPPASLRRFWIMLAHYHGNLFNASELGRSFGASDVTMRKYLDILTGTFMIRQLQPWFKNSGKRQVKAPKIYFRDSGIFHSLLNVANQDQLVVHPKLGSSWEGFALEEVLKAKRPRDSDCYFWSTYSGAECDLLIEEREGLLGFEFKYSDAPKVTKSMKIAIDELNLKHLYVIYPGSVDYRLTEKISVVGLENYLSTSS